MPRLDKTGPRGLGPLTGRVLGSCSAGTRGCFCCYPQVITEKEEQEILKNEAEYLEQELKEIKSRIRN